MHAPRHIFYATLGAAILGASTGSCDTLGSVHAGTYGETTYTEISEIVVTERRIFSNYTYDVAIPNTQRGGPMILCQLHDNAGEVMGQIMENSQTRETIVNFSSTTTDASARCYFAEVERLTRPSGQP